MKAIREFLMQRVVRDERGAEMVEWVLWVGGLALVVVGVSASIEAPITAAVTNILGALPGATPAP